MRMRTKTKSLVHQEWLYNSYYLPILQILLAQLLVLNGQTKEIFAQEIQFGEVHKNFTFKCLTNSENVKWIYNNNETILKNSTRWLMRTKTNDNKDNVLFEGGGANGAGIGVFDNAFTGNGIGIGNEGEGDLENGLALGVVDSRTYEHELILNKVAINDNGTYICQAEGTNETSQQFVMETFIVPKIIASSDIKVKRKIGESASLYCVFQVYPQNETLHKHFKWRKDETSLPFLDLANIESINATHINFTLDLAEVYKKENGSYACVVYDLNAEEIVRKNIDLLVMDVPQATIDYVKAVGKDKFYMNWTINDGNDPIQMIFISYLEEGSPTYGFYKDIIGGGNHSYVLEGFKPNTTYFFRIFAKNNIGNSAQKQYQSAVTTLAENPEFIPQVETTGSTSSTITIGWHPPPPELLEYVQYYELVISEAGDIPKVVQEAVYPQNSRNLPYMFDDLKTATEYEFKVRACSDLTKICGNWSRVVNGTTMDGAASEPIDLKMICTHYGITRPNSLVINWSPPEKPNGKVVSYLINLEGYSKYRVEGKETIERWGPKVRRVDEPHHKTVFEGVNSNTNYTVTVQAITRHKRSGDSATASCSMPASVPESIPRTSWIKVKSSEKQSLFKLYVPRINERNGPICCYRFYLIRMGNQELPSDPKRLSISTYHEVHAVNNTKGGAYIAEMFPGDLFRTDVFLGDGKRFFDDDLNLSKDIDNVCRQCLNGQPFLRKFEDEPVLESDSSQKAVAPPLVPLSSGSELSQSDHLQRASNLTEEASKILENKRRRRRHPKLAALEDIKHDFVNGIALENPTLNATPIVFEDVFDGLIDMNSNYTGFLEAIVRDQDKVYFAYSSYFEKITPITASEQFNDAEIEVVLSVAIHLLAVLIGIVFILLVIFCSMEHFNRKSATADDEAISLRESLRAIFGGRNAHRHFNGSVRIKASDLAPIKKADLYMAYKNRHKDTNYGFLREFEMLPNRFSDRTTKHSDLKENAPKNRYPDIKAYDQTRVKLSQINGLHESDYINANFAIGYKERKKFICAQGPTDITLPDFWRMIWEQHLEIIIMLTNLEEYSKSKCARYWPEKLLDMKKFGEITVKFAGEKKLGDYLIRSFDVFRRSNLSENEEERRQITQYHFLEWKDFQAPEHPQGIIKFIRHINAAYSVQRGPILVHCSAGVGRTGTLVALDSLMQQLQEEDQVSIFNTVCDLRRQRNFLVQSFKQYIFLYRALLDVAYFNNTELNAIGLSATIEQLKAKPFDGREKCKLELEFERVLNSLDETIKTSTVGSNETNMAKNRSCEVIPFDRNRVILTPIPMKDNTTYINASFIEGYDSKDNYIITQDPMENTIGDFWRMVSEQSISTLVMISEIGDGPGRCPRYWADDEIQYDHILVKYVASESCPYYTRREFNVTNCKIDDTITVTQFQYNGWPTVEGEVPEVCRGIIELVDQAQNHHSKDKNIGCRSPITVHCSLGTDRSSIFVAMCILVKQLRYERSVDICSTTRKIRSQRSHLLDTYAQYEFLHRAIANYADLHKLSMDSPPPQQQQQHQLQQQQQQQQQQQNLQND